MDNRCFPCLQKKGSNEFVPSAGSVLLLSRGNLSQSHVHRQHLYLLLVPLHLLFNVISVSNGSGPLVTSEQNCFVTLWIHLFSLCIHFLPCLSISFLLQAFSLQLVKPWQVKELEPLFQQQWIAYCGFPGVRLVWPLLIRSLWKDLVKGAGL